MTLAKLYPSTDVAGAVDWASHRRKLLTSQVTNWQIDWPIVFLLALFSTLRQIHFSHFFHFFSVSSVWNSYMDCGIFIVVVAGIFPFVFAYTRGPETYQTMWTHWYLMLS